MLIGSVDAVGDTTVQAGVTVVAEWTEGTSREAEGLVTTTGATGNHAHGGGPVGVHIGVGTGGGEGGATPLAGLHDRAGAGGGHACPRPQAAVRVGFRVPKGRQPVGQAG